MERSMRLPMLRKCQPGPRVIFSISIPRSAASVPMQPFSTANASPTETYPHAGLSAARASEPNWLTTRSRSLERRSRTCAAERPARFRIAVRLSLRCSSKIRERISCSKSRNWSRCPCGLVLREPRVGRFQTIVHLHQRFPLRPVCRRPDSPVSRIRMQRSTRARCSLRSA